MPEENKSLIPIEFLGGHALFGGIPEKDLEHIRTLLKTEEFAAGEIIIREGDRGDRMYLIYRGNVEVLKMPPGSRDVQERLAVLNEGDAFGEMEIIDIQSRSASVRALENTTLVSLCHGDLYRLSQSHPSVFTFLVMNVAREISRRLRKMDALAANFLFASESNLPKAPDRDA